MKRSGHDQNKLKSVKGEIPYLYELYHTRPNKISEPISEACLCQKINLIGSSVETLMKLI